MHANYLRMKTQWWGSVYLGILNFRIVQILIQCIIMCQLVCNIWIIRIIFLLIFYASTNNIILPLILITTHIILKHQFFGFRLFFLIAGVKNKFRDSCREARSTPDMILGIERINNTNRYFLHRSLRRAIPNFPSLILLYYIKDLLCGWRCLNPTSVIDSMCHMIFSMFGDNLITQIYYLLFCLNLTHF